MSGITKTCSGKNINNFHLLQYIQNNLLNLLSQFSKYRKWLKPKQKTEQMYNNHNYS